jgi:hypothetical protein
MSEQKVYDCCGLLFLDIKGARDHAEDQLKKQIGGRFRYSWEEKPTCSLTVSGVSWRGACRVGPVTFSVDIVERSVL